MSVVAKMDEHLERYTAIELREMAAVWASKKWPESIIVKELSVANWGGAMIDVAVITANELIGIEIKGTGDSASRLKLQAAEYDKVCYRMYLLASPELYEMFKRNRHKPSTWDWLRIEDGECFQPKNYRQSDENLPQNAPQRLCEVLWKKELVLLAKRLGIYATSRMRVNEIARKISEHTPLYKLRPKAIEILRERDFSDKLIIEGLA